MSDGNWQRWAAVSREIIKPLIKLDWRNIATDFWHSSSVGTIKEGISKHGLGEFGFAQVGGQLEVEMRVALSNGRSLETTDLRRSEAKKSKAQAGGAQRHTHRQP